ncbi:MAG: SAM-dependent methyltransferase [Anaerolineaceae bacterium]|nr:SAM-dependent methyltransferase [Anaerolineaceae bacterium]
MTETLYDAIDHYYTEFVHRELQDSSSHFSLRTNEIFRLLDNIDGKQVCDLACGEGYLSRMMAKRDGTVTAVDTSSALLQQARDNSQGYSINFLLDDAQTLHSVADESFDAVVCNMALMDIPDIVSVFQAVNRILKSAGQFIIALLHPCFETPFSVPETTTEVDETGNYVACRILHYNQEGFWQSGGEGIRGKVGAYHRKLSTYLNWLIQAGFTIDEIAEPMLPEAISADSFAAQQNQKIPRSLVVTSTKARTISRR